NVGIGTTAPSTFLQIVGSDAETTSIHDAQFLNIRNNDATSNNYTAIGFKDSDGNDAAMFGVQQISHSTNEADFVFAPRLASGNITERMRIKGDGNVGIGTTSPTAHLTLDGTTQREIRLSSTVGSNQVGLFSAYSNTQRVGYLSFGLSTNAAGLGDSILYHDVTSEQLFVQNRTGGVYLNNGDTAWNANSDQRLKQNITGLESTSGLDSILRLNPVTFNWKDAGQNNSVGMQIGFIAQEVQQVFPGLVKTSGNSTITYADGSTEIVTDTLGLNMTGLIPPMVKSIQEIGQRINLTSAPTTTPSIYITASSTVAIGTETPDTSYALYVNGDVAATSFVNISTRDAKKDIEYYDDNDKKGVLEKLKNVGVATYYYKSESCMDGHHPTQDGAHPAGCQKRLGLIAEEAPKEVLSANGKGVDVYKLATFILAGVQEQQKRIESLELRVTALETLMASSTPSTSGVAATPDVHGFLDYLAGLGAKFTNGLAEFKNVIVESLTVGKSTQPTAITVYDKNGKAGCMTIEDVDAGTTKIVAGVCGSAASTSGVAATPDVSGADTTPPVITVNGNNPSTIERNSVYADLGATVTDNVDTNLGYHLFLDGTPVTAVSLDTSTTTTYTVTYTATDNAGNTATSTRQVIVSDDGGTSGVAATPDVEESEPTATSTPTSEVPTPPAEPTPEPEPEAPAPEATPEPEAPAESTPEAPVSETP
ncbi:MAG: tail fiber domain-containing protein, partial [bacterium]|nr:tail fiber domain-containing protein [bacterium]